MNARYPIPDEFRDGIFTPHWMSYSLKRMRGPDLVVPFRGVRAVAGGPADPAADPDEALRIRCRAALLTVCQGAVISSVTAARIWPLPMPLAAPDEPLHIDKFAPDHAPRRRGVIGHQIRDQEVGTEYRFGIAVTDPASLFCHLGAVLSTPDLVAIGDALILRPRYGSGDRRAGVSSEWPRAPSSATARTWFGGSGPPWSVRGGPADVVAVPVHTPEADPSAPSCHLRPLQAPNGGGMWQVGGHGAWRTWVAGTVRGRSGPPDCRW